jgi:hypothetical protein
MFGLLLFGCFDQVRLTAIEKGFVELAHARLISSEIELGQVYEGRYVTYVLAARLAYDGPYMLLYFVGMFGYDQPQATAS